MYGMQYCIDHGIKMSEPKDLWRITEKDIAEIYEDQKAWQTGKVIIREDKSQKFTYTKPKRMTLEEKIKNRGHMT